MNRFFKRIFLTLLIWAAVGVPAAQSEPNWLQKCGRFLLSKVSKKQYAYLEYPAFKSQQQENLALLEQNILPKVASSDNKYRTPPGGLPSLMETGIATLYHVVHSPSLYFKLLQELELEVYQLSFETGTSLENAFVAILQKEEQRLGFAEPVIISKFLSNSDFLSLMAQGRPVQDLFYRNKPHTVYIHRIQHVLMARYFEVVVGQSNFYLELYKFMGDEGKMKSLDWKVAGFDTTLPIVAGDSGFPDIHGVLFDSPFFSKTHGINPNDFTNPIFFSSLRKYLPGLVGWE